MRFLSLNYLLTKVFPLQTQVIAEKGKRTVSQVASAERGTLVTMVAIVNAAGNHVPPVIVYPRKRTNPAFLKGTVPGSIALLAESGWMNADLFPKVLEHIVKHTRCSVQDPIMVLLDNHVSHCGLESIIFCRENGIILLSFSPHTSHKLQPLDVAVFGPFKKYCKAAFNNYLVNNPGRIIGINDIAEISCQPFLKAFSPENIIKGFSSTGIVPINDAIFQDFDFQEFEETEKSPVRVASPNQNIQRNPNESYQHLTPEAIRPCPKMHLKQKRKVNSVSKSRIYTDTPEKTGSWN